MMQYDLFDSPPPPHTELPKPLVKHSHGIHLGAHFVPYQLLRSRRRSIGFLITHQGLRITAPRWATKEAINAAIVSQERWILRKLHEQQNRPKPAIQPPLIWSSGARFSFLGQTATLRMQEGEANSFDQSTCVLTLNLPPDATSAQCKQSLYTWLMNQAHQQFSQRLQNFAGQLGVQFDSFALSNAKTQWGSCNIQGKIRLNWRLIFCPTHLIDYVIAHELAHRLEMNHSPRFWEAVGRVFPDYRTARKELRQIELREF